MAATWNTFNIGVNATVNFAQPSASSVALNRVTSGDPSQIMGQLNANGQVYLINPSGILFGAGSSVNVGGLVARR
jgi:filamentous hemagglutinin family protein